MAWAIFNFVDNGREKSIFFDDTYFKKVFNSIWNPKHNTCTSLGYSSTNTLVGEYSITFKFSTSRTRVYVSQEKMTRIITDIQVTTMSDTGEFKVVHTSGENDHIVVDKTGKDGMIVITSVPCEIVMFNAQQTDDYRAIRAVDANDLLPTWNQVRYRVGGELKTIYFRITQLTNAIFMMKNTSISVPGYYKIPDYVPYPLEKPIYDCTIQLIIGDNGAISKIWIDEEVIYSSAYNKVEMLLNATGIILDILSNNTSVNQEITVPEKDDNQKCSKSDNDLVTLLYHINSGIPISLSRIIELCGSSSSSLTEWIWSSLLVSLKNILSKGISLNTDQKFIMVTEKLEYEGGTTLINFVPVKDSFDFDGEVVNVYCE